MFLHQSTLELLTNKGNSQSIWFVNYSALEKMDSLDAMEGEAALNTHSRTHKLCPNWGGGFKSEFTLSRGGS